MLSNDSISVCPNERVQKHIKSATTRMIFLITLYLGLQVARDDLDDVVDVDDIAEMDSEVFVEGVKGV